MAIAFGAITARINAASGTGPTVSGSNTYGVILHYGDTGADNTTSATWGGSAMTKIGGTIVPSDRGVTAWGIVNPSSGATIQVNGCTSNGFVAWYYTGAKQSGQPDSSNTGTSTGSTTLTIATTVVATDSWTVMVHKDNQGNKTYTTNVGTMRFNTDNAGFAVSDSNGTVGTGSQSTTLTTGTAANHGGIAFSIAPVPTTNYPIDLALGTFALTGYSVLLNSTRSLILSAGSFALTGFDLLFSIGKGITIATGNFVLTGYDVALTSTRTMVIAMGSFALTGYDLLFQAARTIRIETGYFIATIWDVIIRTTAYVFDTEPSSESYTMDTENTSGDYEFDQE